ncbi:type II toxin-antitoxin system RelE family toxin [Floridanema evergladense]|uniref:Type II toxin-antitoxin system RelE/ParE family toxin n=1 Tax=Floridaenema evergladense BLCC-F167 TaxID=3153639 RepID=A0ABV4WJB8_9CYAN
MFKLRVGDYRVVYTFSTESRIITIHRIGHRSEIYG